MGYSMMQPNENRAFPPQPPIPHITDGGDIAVHEGMLNTYFGEKYKFNSEGVQTNDIIPCVCAQILCKHINCVDEQGALLTDKEGLSLPRSVFIGKMTISCHPKSNLSQFHEEIFGEQLTADLWNNKYQEGDMWIAVTNGRPIKFTVSTPIRYGNEGKFKQTPRTMFGFTPNPEPSIANNPYPRDVNNREKK